MFAYIKSKPIAFTSVIVLLILYVMMIAAPFFAPYEASKTFEENTFHPANIHLTKHGLKVREARVLNSITWQYAFVKDYECDLVFFAKGYEYKLFGLIKCDRHLFGTKSIEGKASYPVYLMGADNLGRDIFSRIVWGSRISLTIGFVATFISLLLAVFLGGISGYYGGKTDWAIMRFAEFFMLIPSTYLILFLRSLLNTKMDSGESYMIITLILSLVGWPGSARTIRGMVHSIKREEFVLNAELEGVPSYSIIVRHIIPQIASLLIVSTALSIPGFIMSETTLSYLGLGISDPSVSWGSMINREVSTLSNLKRYPWLLNPVWVLLLVTLGFNFLGDALRDFFDPYHVVFPTWKKRFLKKADKADKKSGETLATNEERKDDSPKDASAASTKDKVNTASTEDKVNAASTTNEAQKADTSSNEILRVEDLHITFSTQELNNIRYTQAVKGISFNVKKGEILGLVGESGSGKSVSTTAIPGLLPANAFQEGKIFFEGVELTSLNENEKRSYRGKKIGLIFQEPGRSFDPLQRIENVFLEVFRNLNPNITKEESFAKAAELLREVGINDSEKRLKNYPHQFSGGQLQRIGIALALAQGCSLLIADEPTTALDVTIQAQIVDLILNLRNTRGLSVIFISHNLELVAKISDRINVMYKGEIVESGKASEIMNHPKHPYTKALLGSIPKFGQHYSNVRLATISDSLAGEEI